MAPTLAQRIIAAQEREVGTTESPYGSNSGARVRQYQAATYLGGSGWPWCGAFTCWSWQQAGMDARTAKRIASPSVAMMCSVARREGLVTSPRPGAALCYCGVHVTNLHHQISAGTWRCIGGNESQRVGWSTRSVGGQFIYAPKGMGEAPAPETVKVYGFEDPGVAPKRYGAWSTRAAREKVIKSLAPALQKRVRRIKKGSRYAFEVLRPSQPPYRFGPWQSKAKRDKLMKARGAKVKRRMRPYSDTRPVKS